MLGFHEKSARKSGTVTNNLVVVGDLNERPGTGRVAKRQAKTVDRARILREFGANSKPLQA